MKTVNLNELIETLPLLQNLRWNKETREFDTVYLKPHASIVDGLLRISAEHGDNAAFDYEINPALETWAKQNGGYFEWYDNGCFVFSI
jgi:hypothetical protein